MQVVTLVTKRFHLGGFWGRGYFRMMSELGYPFLLYSMYEDSIESRGGGVTTEVIINII